MRRHEHLLNPAIGETWRETSIPVGDPWDYMEAVNVVAPRVITQALTPNVLSD